MKPILQIEDLTHTYSAGTPFQRSAVEGLSMTVGAGEFLGVIGHTGSGKSTLIQHLNGLLQPTSGRILLEGKDIWADPKKIRDVRFKVGLVFQYPEYQLFEETVYKDIAFGPKNMGLDAEEIDRRVRDAAAFVGLHETLLDKSPFELSGGQKRRVAIAGVIAMEPKVLVLDEPTAGLDPQGRDTILAQIQAYHRAKGAAVVLVSHSMEEIARNVDRIVVLSDGKVYMEGTPKQVFARAHELEQVGLDVPQVTKVAAALKARGLDIDTAVYTVEALEQKLLTLRGGCVSVLKDITLGQFFPADTPVHRLDPRTKLLCVILYIVALFSAKSVLTYGIMITVLAVSVLVSRVPFKSLTKGLKPVYFVVAFTAVMNMFFTAGTPVADVWLLRSITWEGVVAAVQMVLRIVMLIMGTFLMTYTTSPIALTDGMESLLGPLKKLRLPIHELAMMMSIALRFIPTLIEETDKIMSAQKARGADFETGNIFRRAKALVPILVPLFISAFRRADELATAMECRCYHGGEGRTALRVLRYKAADWLVLVAFLALTAGIIVLKKLGF